MEAEGAVKPEPHWLLEYDVQESSDPDEVHHAGSGTPETRNESGVGKPCETDLMEGDGSVGALPPSGEKPHECVVCAQSFSQLSSLNAHRLTHKGDGDYYCDLCPKQFSRPGNLKRHMLTHSGEKDYKCPVCAKQFSRRDSLKTHSITHAGKQKYEHFPKVAPS